MRVITRLELDLKQTVLDTVNTWQATTQHRARSRIGCFIATLKSKTKLEKVQKKVNKQTDDAIMQVVVAINCQRMRFSITERVCNLQVTTTTIDTSVTAVIDPTEYRQSTLI